MKFQHSRARPHQTERRSKYFREVTAESTKYLRAVCSASAPTCPSWISKSNLVLVTFYGSMTKRGSLRRFVNSWLQSPQPNLARGTLHDKILSARTSCDRSYNRHRWPRVQPDR